MDHQSNQTSISRCLPMLIVFVGSACSTPQTAPQPLQKIKTHAPQKAPAKIDLDYWKNKKDLIRSPALGKALPLKLPPKEELKLANGLQVIMMNDNYLPLIHVQLTLRSGSIDDPKDKVGLAEFTSMMLRQGTKRMSADGISRLVDKKGVTLGAGSGYETTTIHCSGRRQHLKLCLQMVADLAFAPSFPFKEMDEIRDKLLSGVKQLRDDPSALAATHFDNLLYGDDHPGGFVMTETSLQKIKRRDLIRFHQMNFVPQEAILGISGDFDQRQLKKSVRGLFSRWKRKRQRRKKITPVSDPPTGFKVLLVDKPDLSQSFIALGHAGQSKSDPARNATTIANYVLGGGGFSSRLMKVIRALGGKTYGVSSHFFRSAADGSFIIQTFTRNAELVKVLLLIQKELNKFHEVPPTDEEILAAKGKIAGGYGIRMKTSASIVAKLIEARLFGLPESDVVNFPVQIEELTQKQIHQAARTQFRPNHLVAAIVGKAREVAPLLRQAKISFSTINFLDPISAQKRSERRSSSSVSISEKEMQKARLILEKAQQHSGGDKKFEAVKSLRLVGKAQAEARGGKMEGGYLAEIIFPNFSRIALNIKPVPIVQTLAGGQAAIRVGSHVAEVPTGKVQELMAGLWRHPVMVVHFALADSSRARILQPEDQSGHHPLISVEVFPDGMSPCVLRFDPKSYLLKQIQYLDQKGETRTLNLTDYRQVEGMLLPHQFSEINDNRKQTIILSRIDINPPLKSADLRRDLTKTK